MSVGSKRFKPPSIAIVGVFFSFILVVQSNSPLFSLPTAPPFQGEIRGVWLTNIDSSVLFSAENVDRALQQLADLNFNTIYPTVWNWGHTLYPSAVARRVMGQTVDPTVPSFQTWDMLADIVEQGHQRNMAVIPWFEFGFMTTAESDLARLHPDWITQRRDGSEIWQDGKYQRRWLNPFHPEVQQFIQALILELVTHYDIDGIQVDDHFGLPAEFGYDPYTVQLYRQEHNGKLPPSNADDAAWVRWRADKITAFMTDVFHAIKARKSNAIFSLAPNPYRYSYTHFLQDWRFWEQHGLVEELIVQAYSDDPKGFTAILQSPEVQAARLHIPTAIGILAGLKDHPVPIRQVQQQMQTVRDQRFTGASFFFYETLWNLSSEPRLDRQWVFRWLFPLPTTRPDIFQG